MGTQITLPPTPQPARTLQELQQSISIWTRQACQLLKELATNSGGGTTQIADATHNGLLSSTDWSTFNGKQNALGFTPLNAIKGTKTIVLCAAYTPALVGADFAEVTVPYGTDGSVLTYTITRIRLRVASVGGGESVSIEKSSVTGGFSATTVGTVTLGTGQNENHATTSLGTTQSGDKLRFNVQALGTAQNWTVSVEIAP